MFQAYGLYGHIQANRIRSVMLLAGFVVLLHVLLFSLLMIWSAFSGGTLDEIVAGAVRQFGRSWPIAMIGAAVWFVIAYLAHQTLIGMATGARGVTRTEAPKLYNVLENLCISRGLPMPALQIIDTPALNAYASGLREGQYLIAVTRGLVDTLADDELEAVLAPRTHPHPQPRHPADGDRRHLRRHLRVLRRHDHPRLGLSLRLVAAPRRADGPWGSSQQSGGCDVRRRERRPRRSGRSSGGGGGAILAIAIAIAIILITWGVSTLIRFALSRSREFLADAGSAELTKNPDALIRALRKIQNHASFDVPSRMEAFFIENPVSKRLSGLLATHPSMDERVEALQRYAGALDTGTASRATQPGPQ